MKTPESQRNKVDICMFVDSDYSRDRVSCKSRSGFFVYVNTTFLQWFLKKQSPIETSAFDAKFVTMK